MERILEKGMPVVDYSHKAKLPDGHRKRIFNKWLDEGYRMLVWTATAVLCLCLLAIIVFVGKTGVLVFKDVPAATFFTSFDWVPENGQFGSGVFIVGTLYLTLLSLVFSVPISLAVAAFNSVIAPNWLKNITRPVLDILVGVPSVVYGYIGVTVLIPIIRQTTGTLMGDGMLVSAMVLAFMVLPTITRISDDALTSLPKEYMEAAYAMGATKTYIIWTVLLPAARNGIITATVLGMARAIGETMAVVMVIGNVAQLPMDLLTPTAVLTSNIVSQIINVEFASTWNYALYMMAFLLLMISLVLIICVNFLRRKGGQH